MQLVKWKKKTSSNKLDIQLHTGYSLSDQHILHQLTQNTTTDFVRFTKIYTNCSENQNLQNLYFEFQDNFSKSS